MKDLRLEFRARNNVLWHVIFDTYPNVFQFCHTNGFTSPGLVGAYLNLKANPYTKNGKGLREIPQRLCDLTGIGRTELFPPDLYAGLFPTHGAAEVESHRFVSLACAERLALPPAQEDAMHAAELTTTFDAVMQTLTAREEQVVRARFGLDGQGERTLEQVAECHGVSRERVRQIEHKALRKLRHPARSRHLSPFLAGR